LRTPPVGLPQVAFLGDASLDGFHTVDGVVAEDLVKWDFIGFNGIGANLTNDEKRAHLSDLRREHLIDQVCVQEILPPE